MNKPLLYQYKDGTLTTEADALRLVCGFIIVLGENTDDRAFDLTYSSKCKNFDPQTEDPVTFLRNISDACVYTSGCSDNIIRMMQITLEPFDPEDLIAQDSRRIELKELWV